MEVYEYISESLMTTGDLILEYYPDLPLEFIVIPVIIFIGVFLKQRSKNIQKEVGVTYPRSIRNYISMLFHQKLFWYIQKKHQDKEITANLLAPQPYEEKLCFLLGTTWKKQKRARQHCELLQDDAKVEDEQILPETESNSDEEDDTSDFSTNSMETAIQSEQVLTEITYETISEGDSDFRTAEYASTHKILTDYQSAEKSSIFDNGEDFQEDEDEEESKLENLSASAFDEFEESTCQLEGMPIQNNEHGLAELPQNEETDDAQVSSHHDVDPAGDDGVTEPKGNNEEEEANIEENSYEKDGESPIMNEELLPPASDSRSLEEEPEEMSLETIAEVEEDSVPVF